MGGGGVFGNFLGRKWPLHDRPSDLRGLPLISYAPRGRGGGGQSCDIFPLRIYMQKGWEEVQIACKNAYLINGRPLIEISRG